MRADETLLALQVLKSLPAYQRDNTPKDIQALKSKILSSIIRPIDLLSDHREMPKTDAWSKEFLDNTSRGFVLKSLVKEYNDKNITPHIIDHGPGDCTFAIGMHCEDLKFFYTAVTLNKESEKAIIERLYKKYLEHPIEESPVIFLAYEILEHLFNPEEIRQAYERISKKPEYILLSTPKYCFGEGSINWKRDGAHHLKVYTPREFSIECLNLFPEYNIEHIDGGDIQIVKGRLKQ